MRTLSLATIATICALSTAHAQPVTGIGGLQRVAHDSTMTGDGTGPHPLSVVASTTGLTGTLTTSAIPKANGPHILVDSLVSDNGAQLTYNTSKFTVQAASGNTVVAGTLSVGGNTQIGGTAAATLAAINVAGSGLPTSTAGGSAGSLYVVQPASNNGVVVARAAVDTGAAKLTLYHTRNANAAVDTALVNADSIGVVSFQGATDGATVNAGAEIAANVTGAVSTGVLPSALLLRTTTTGGVLTTALTLANDQSATFASSGTFALGLTADATHRVFDIAGTGLTSSTNTVSLSINGGVTQTATAGQAFTSMTSAGVMSSSVFVNAAGTGLVLTGSSLSVGLNGNASQACGAGNAVTGLSATGIESCSTLATLGAASGTGTAGRLTEWSNTSGGLRDTTFPIDDTASTLTIGNSTSDATTVNGVIAVTNPPTSGNAINSTFVASSGTTAPELVRGVHSGTYNTAGGNIQIYAGDFESTSTRASGANSLINTAVYLDAHGAQTNYAIYSPAGDALFSGVLSTSSTLSVTGLSTLTGGFTAGAASTVTAGSSGAAASIAGTILTLDNASTGNSYLTIKGGDAHNSGVIFNNVAGGAADGYVLYENAVTAGSRKMDFAVAGVQQLNITSVLATFANAVTVTGALTASSGINVNSQKITNCLNGTASSDGACYGQLATAVNAAVSGTSGTMTRFTGPNAVGNASMTDDGAATIRDVKSSSQAMFTVGDDVSLTTNAQSGFKAWAFSDGNIYIDSKTNSGGSTLFRAGAGTESGATRSWLTVTNATAAVNFPGAALFSTTLGVTGALTASSTAHIVGAETLDGALDFDSVTNGSSIEVINGVGFSGGTTQFRSIQIDNGKGAQFALFDGTKNSLEVDGNIAAGATAATVFIGDNGVSCLWNTNASGSCEFNAVGFSNGTTQFRNFRVRDGKNNQAFFINASNATQYIEADYGVTGSGGFGVKGAQLSVPEGITGDNGYGGHHLEWNDDWANVFQSTTAPTAQYIGTQYQIQSSGSQQTILPVAGVTGRPGVIALAKGIASTVTDYTAIVSDPNGVNFGDGDWSYQWVGGVSATSSNGSSIASAYVAEVGFLDSPSVLDQVDGCYFVYDRPNILTGGQNASNTDNLEAVCSNNSTRTIYLLNGVGTCDAAFAKGTVTAAAVTFPNTNILNLKVKMDGSTTAHFFSSGTEVCRITTNIPSGSARLTGFGYLIHNEATTGTGDKELYTDFTSAQVDLTSARSP